MRIVLPKTREEIEQSRKERGDLPSLKDITVDLSVKKQPSVTRKLRMVGHAMEFYEVQDKVRVGKEFVKKPFPDAHLNSNFTRIAHEEADKCPWRKLGYVLTKRYVQRCFELQDDGTWVHKILVKGPMVFNDLSKWEAGRRSEAADYGDDSMSTFLGGLNAPIVKIEANYDPSKLGDVNYQIHVTTKDMELTEDMINMLRAVKVPSADEINKARADYNKHREKYPVLPEFQDYFTFGHDIERIFKFTPLREDTKPSETSETNQAVSDKITENAFSEEDMENSTESVSEDLDLDSIAWDTLEA